MAQHLTRREKDVLKHIKDFCGKHGFSPSLNEIKDVMGLTSVSTIHEHVSRLIYKGYLRKDPNKARSVKIRGENDSSLKITSLQELVSQSLDGPVCTLEPEEVFQTGKGAVAVAIQGNSLSHEGILNGDFVIVIPGNGVMDGDTIIGSTEDHKPILGRLFHLGSKIVIKPTRSDRDSLVLNPESAVIVGRVKGVIRQL